VIFNYERQSQKEEERPLLAAFFCFYGCFFTIIFEKILGLTTKSFQSKN